MVEADTPTQAPRSLPPPVQVVVTPCQVTFLLDVFILSLFSPSQISGTRKTRTITTALSTSLSALCSSSVTCSQSTSAFLTSTSG